MSTRARNIVNQPAHLFTLLNTNQTMQKTIENDEKITFNQVQKKRPNRRLFAVEENNANKKLVLHAVDRFSQILQRHIQKISVNRRYHLLSLIQLSNVFRRSLLFKELLKWPFPSASHLFFQLWIHSTNLFLADTLIWPFSVCFGSQFAP